MEIAVVIHSTFTRFEHLEKAVESFLKNPRFKIYIAYTGELNIEKLKYFDGFNIFDRVDFNYCGWDTTPAQTRNFLVDKIKEKYVFKVDDDFICTITDHEIDRVIGLLDNNKDLGLVGLGVKTKKAKSRFLYNVKKSDEIKLLPVKIESDLVICDVTPDIWIAKREIFPECGWDERYHVGEGLHPDFFLHIKYNTKWKVGYCDNIVMHSFKFDEGWEQTPKERRESFYFRKRMRNYPDNSKLLKKWGVKSINVW